MNDLISRQAVLALPRNKVRSLRTYEVIEETINVTDIEQLPSAQPEIIHCYECKHWKNNHLCESLSRYGTFNTNKNFYCGYAERK